jgi:two-component system, NarL family, sensor histidine kinase DesK
MSRELPGTADDSGTLREIRRAVLSVLIAIILFQPAFRLLTSPLTAADFVQLGAITLLIGLVLWKIWASDPGAQRTPWPILLVILGLAIVLFVVGGDQAGAWIPALAFAAAMCGRYSSSPVPAIVGGTACAITGLVVASLHHYTSGVTFSSIVIGPLAAVLAYSAGRRADTLEKLRRTRAELARAAVAQERLRIARDLHDLLGHSLSLITLKAELAGRVIGADPDRAAREIAELESVARQSLSDVREAVAGFRQQDLAAELTAARQLLDAAGIASEISAAGSGDLAQKVDAALAWAVREGTTNVVRHSQATRVTIRVSVEDEKATAEIGDNGHPRPDQAGSAGQVGVLTAAADGRAALPGPRTAFAGSGLAGLAERVRGLGGEVVAGSVGSQGFLLRVVVPLGPQA